MPDIRPALCPHCGYFCDAASPLGHRDSATPGDISMCLSCGNLNVFTQDMGLRKALVEDIVNLSNEAWETVKKAARAQREVVPPQGLIPKGPKQ